MQILRLFFLGLAVSLAWSAIVPAHAQAAGPVQSTTPLIAPPATQPAIANKSLFDPTRHMRVSEVRPGMKGYGLTVFKGTTIERFDVQVISVLRNFNPKCDVVLIRCQGKFLEHTGSIAGMSGSPVYLTDAQGHDRMIGAFAYGWPLTKDPVAGVQPIEYMLDLPVVKPGLVGVGGSAANESSARKAPSVPTAGADVSSTSTRTPNGHISWSMADAGLLPIAWRSQRQKWMKPWRAPASLSGQLTGDGDSPRLAPLATPLMISGMSPRMLDELAPTFRAAGLSTLQAGIGGSGPDNQPPAKLEPGSVLAVPLLTGDVEMTAIGTCTEVLGDKVWGFGHPFNNEGPIALPMGSGEINGVIANLQTSFKLGSLTATRGTLTMDGAVGVAGETGAGPATAPIELTVNPADGTAPRVYHFQASLHPKLTPMIINAAFAAAVSGSSELPQYNTVDYDLKLTFNNGKIITVANRAVNATSNDVFGDAGVIMQAAADNPFQRVLIKKVTGTIKVLPYAELAQILDVNLPRSKYHPGDTIKAFVNYQTFRGPDAILPIDLELPRDLPHGTYQLIVSDAERFFQDEVQSKHFQFTAESIRDVFSVLKDVAAIRENAIYVRLLRRPDGVAIGHTALPRLPSSRRQILLESGRSNTTAFVSSTVKTIPTKWVMAGSAEFAINVEAISKVAVGTSRPPRPESPAGAKAETPHKATPGKSPPTNETPPKTEPPSEPKPAK
ncbi:MAG TPA: hypothetical protein VFC78_18605 [Tepidisphaeraceae bacterium]|nr:hypothetical protein [Tepidisphaeraceae bacterium]